MEFNRKKIVSLENKSRNRKCAKLLHAILNDFGSIVKTMQDHAATLRIDSLKYAKKLTIKPDYVIENNS